MHAEQEESVDFVPAVYPWPGGHDATVQLTHAFVSDAGEKKPDAHGVHVASFVASPARNPAPAEQLDTLKPRHAPVSWKAEYLPLPHAKHFVSEYAVPGVKPWPTGHLE